MNDSRQVRLQQAERIDNMSGALVKIGVNAVKKNPVMFSSYAIGVIICIFFSGVALTIEQKNQFELDLAKIDYRSLDDATLDYEEAYRRYSNAKGFFSCDSVCQEWKEIADSRRRRVDSLQADIDKQLSDAKSKLGLFSEVGVGEARELFWRRFGQGKQFAQRQTKWDALFMGIGAMRRDEGLVGYLLRLLLSMLFNFTIGMVGSVIGFMWSLYSVIASYQASIWAALVFFGFASLAAVSFALTWVFGLYAASAGAVYVTAKLIASNMRLEDGTQPRRRVHFD